MATITFDQATRLYEGAERPAVDSLDLDIGDAPLPDLESCLRELLDQSRTNVSALNLTPREREILAALVDESSNRDIAVKFGISEITVKAHRGRAMRKMGAKSLADLVNIAAKLGLSSHN